MAAGRAWVSFVLALAPVCLGAVGANPGSIEVTGPLVEQEHRVWKSAVHKSAFAPVPNSLNRTPCEVMQPPQALATPDPSLDRADRASRPSTTFIVGTDGRVHSALILDSAGPDEDHAVLEAVRSWRYRPALCDGIPANAEGKVEFSSRGAP